MKNPRVLILTEGGKNIGIGHITRCTAIYQAFEEKGANPEFIINGDSTISYLLEDKNYQIFNWLKEKHRLFKIIDEVDSVVIDSYIMPKSFYDKISQKVSGKIVMIDDLNRIKYPKGIVVNPSIYGDKLNYPENKGIIYLLGKDYIILRKPFWNVPEKNIRKKVKNILITFGGSEQSGFLKKLLKFLSINFPGFTYHLVVPDFCLESNFNLALNTYNNLSALEIRDLMLKCDFCISAGGQTLYELVRTGTPVIAICFAENQLMGLEHFSRKRLIEDVGRFNETDLWHKLTKSFKKLILYKERIKKVSDTTGVIDGKGPKRIIDVVLNKLLKGTK